MLGLLTGLLTSSAAEAETVGDWVLIETVEGELLAVSKSDAHHYSWLAVVRWCVWDRAIAACKRVP
jgi:hypothetical protein